jgi:hypothetical protein
MKLTDKQMGKIDELQTFYDLSAQQCVRLAFKLYRVKVTRQCIWKRLNALSLSRSALAL